MRGQLVLLAERIANQLVQFPMNQPSSGTNKQQKQDNGGVDIIDQPASSPTETKVCIQPDGYKIYSYLIVQQNL